jgi:hypothetical protein
MCFDRLAPNDLSSSIQGCAMSPYCMLVAVEGIHHLGLNGNRRLEVIDEGIQLALESHHITQVGLYQSQIQRTAHSYPPIGEKCFRLRFGFPGGN